MVAWNRMTATLRAYPQLAMFLALAFGFRVGPKKLAGFSLATAWSRFPNPIAVPLPQRQE